MQLLVRFKKVKNPFRVQGNQFINKAMRVNTVSAEPSESFEA